MAAATPLVTQHSTEGVLVLRPTGTQFVLEHAREVVQIVFEGPAGAPRDVVMDLGHVQYVNSSGMSVLIRLNVERRLAIAGLSAGAREILDIAGVLGFLRVAPDVNGARALLRA